MKKRIILVLVFVLLLTLSLCLVACNNSGGSSTPTDNSDNSGNAPSGGGNGKSNFSGVTFDNLTVTYDGENHILPEVSGLPTGATVKYTGREEKKNAGTYPATAKITKEGYNDLTLNATLTINKATFTGITFSNSTLTYDGDSHILSEATGVPSFANVVYSGRSSQTNAGTYPASATISADNYNDLVLNATLTINKASFSGITFASDTLTYDGNSHILAEATGVPSFANVAYSGRASKTNAGTYPASATISAPNYNDLVLNATLTINKATFNNLTFEDDSFDYDGNPHSIYISGTVPSTASVVYESDVNGITNTATEIGTYNITATVSDSNFNTLVLEATLKINADDDERILAISGSTLFFENAIHKDYFYMYNFSDGEILRIENSKVKDIDATTSNQIVYVSDATLFSSLKTAAYDTSGKTVSHDSLLNKSAAYVQYGGTNTFYYVINGLTNNNSGIYKVDTSGSEPVITLLSAGKAKYLKLYGSYLYFADGANGSKLSKINTTDTEQVRTVVVDEKINNLYEYEGVLYFTVNKTLGNYIARYDISSGVTRKLTQDAGSDMVVVGDYLYYINVDKLTTKIKGDGIYKVLKSPAADINSSGTLVIDDPGMGLISLTAYNNAYLIYYDVDGYKLMKYNISSQTAVNILDGFVAPADPTPTSLGSQTACVDGVIYYLDIWDGKTLHMYNPQTTSNFRITADKVKAFYFIGDYIYMNVVTFGVNNNTYRVNYKTCDAPELINSYDCVNIVSDGTYIYYVKNNGSGVATEIHKANMDGTGDICIYEYGTSCLELYNNTLFFEGKTGATSYQYVLKLENVSSLTGPVARSASLRVNDDARATYVKVVDGVIYYRNTKGTNSLARVNVDGTILVEIAVGSNVDVSEIIVSGSYVYYFNNYTSHNDYEIYKISKTSVEGTATQLTTGVYASAGCVCGDKIYYVNYNLGGTLGDSHLYCVSINGGAPELIA